jgi:hypothetical protein
VTITIGYTPEQLQARGIAESDLTLTAKTRRKPPPFKASG